MPRSLLCRTGFLLLSSPKLLCLSQLDELFLHSLPHCDLWPCILNPSGYASGNPSLLRLFSPYFGSKRSEVGGKVECSLPTNPCGLPQSFIKAGYWLTLHGPSMFTCKGVVLRERHNDRSINASWSVGRLNGAIICLDQEIIRGCMLTKESHRKFKFRSSDHRDEVWRSTIRRV